MRRRRPEPRTLSLTLSLSLTLTLSLSLTVTLTRCDGANSAEDFQQINKAVNYAEMAFDQMQMHADLKVVNGDSANAALEKVMGMLGGSPAAIEAAKKAAASAIQGSLATGEDAEAAQRNAIAAQLGRNVVSSE